MAVPPLIAVIADAAVAARLGAALRAAGYRATPLPRAAALGPAALGAWLARRRPAALVLDARALRLSDAPHIPAAAAAHGVEVVVAAIYGEAEGDAAAALPVGRRLGVADVVRGVQRAIGPATEGPTRPR